MKRFSIRERGTDQTVIIEAYHKDDAVLRLMKIAHTDRGIVGHDQWGHVVTAQNSVTYVVEELDKELGTVPAMNSDQSLIS